LALKITGALPKEPVEAFSGWNRFTFRPRVGGAGCTGLAPVGRQSPPKWVGWINKQLLLLNSWKKLMQASF
jgi:hypothetical protein